MNNSKYKYRWASVHNGSCKYRLRSPEARSECLIDFILKKKRGRITIAELYRLGVNIGRKYHANDTSFSRFLSKFHFRYLKGEQYDPAQVLPIPIPAVNVTVIKENRLCIVKQNNNELRRKYTGSDVFYLWMDENGNTKIGITTSTSNTDRIKQCARHRNTDVIWSMRFKVTNPRQIESLMLSRFPIKPYDDGIDGYTEFRTLSRSEILKIVEYVEDSGGVRL